MRLFILSIQQEVPPMSNRTFTGFILNCLACNRSLDTNESTRTYPKSPELIGLCNTCLHKSKDIHYAYEFEHSALTESSKIEDKYDPNR